MKEETKLKKNLRKKQLVEQQIEINKEMNKA